MIPYFTIDAINLGFVKLHVWGMFAALAFLVAIILSAREAKRRKLDPEVIYDVAPWIIIGGVIGARFVFILENPGAVSGFLDYISVWNGGLAFHGGFAGAVIAFFIYVNKKKLQFWKYADAVAPNILVGHAIGRIGCYLTGLHIGRPTDAPWGVFHEGQLRHPTPLYEFLGLMGLFLFFIWLKDKRIARAFDGFLFTTYVALYSALRFFIEFFRDDLRYFLNLTAAQFIVIALFAASTAYIVYMLSFRKAGHKSASAL